MANEILLAYDTGLTAYFVIINAAGQRWNGSAFESYNVANWDDYDVALTEQGATGDYFGTFPAGVSAGTYSLTFYSQDGGSPAVDDEKLDSIVFEWDGSAEITLRMVDSVADTILADTNELQTDLVDGGRLDLLIDGIKAKTDNLPASPAAVGSAMTLADSAITAAKFAADSITSSALAAAAVTEIQAGLAAASSLAAVAGDVDTIGAGVATAISGISTVEGKVDGVVSGVDSLDGKIDVVDGVVDSIMALMGDFYYARITYIRDQADTEDKYAVQWFKNRESVTSGVTSPTINVVKYADGADLIAASTPMTQIGAIGAYKFATTTAGERLTKGEIGIAEVRATIDGVERVWREIVGRDSS